MSNPFDRLPDMGGIFAAVRRATGADVIHACPPSESGFTPCCDQTPFDLPPGDRMTTDPAFVTCNRPEATS